MTPELVERAHRECRHRTDFKADVRVVYLSDIDRYLAEISIKCAECGHSFQFLNLPLGLNYEGAALSVDGQEARLAIAPVGRVLTPLEGLSGFGVKPS